MEEKKNKLNWNMVLIPAIAMCVNLLRLPEEVRLKTTLKELAYCITVYYVMTFSSPLHGHASLVILFGG